MTRVTREVLAVPSESSKKNVLETKERKTLEPRHSEKKINHKKISPTIKHEHSAKKPLK
jgi:hypothetical protein